MGVSVFMIWKKESCAAFNNFRFYQSNSHFFLSTHGSLTHDYFLCCEMNGEIFLSLIREFSVVNCKSMADPSWLCCYGHASLSFLLLSLSEMHLSKHCRLRWLHSISAIFNQMPYFGVCRISSLSSHRFALAG